MLTIIDNFFGILAKADSGTIRAYVYIFVFGPIIIAALWLIAMIIGGILTFFGWRPRIKERDNPGNP